ncbi:hypothetical protein GWI33_019697 [Rhynchophorus ferrugineus]|uniref:Uncharacterized protein n=1 Tax=Rhynchophorus ferrugineus TaxID=354439 RepID=A0A834HS87_RHYFE|nr:hypothetical protein GWI33_019697 [Rhynchophorus ferrugineus]
MRRRSSRAVCVDINFTATWISQNKRYYPDFHCGIFRNRYHCNDSREKPAGTERFMSAILLPYKTSVNPLCTPYNFALKQHEE